MFPWLAKTEAFNNRAASRNRVEMLLAHLKRILRLGRLRRGLLRAKDEFTLAAIAQNLRPACEVRRQTAASGHGVCCISVASVLGRRSCRPLGKGD